MPARQVPPSLYVRRARRDDLAALVALEQRCFATDRLSPRQYRRHLASARNQVLVVRDGGQAVGSAVVFLRKNSAQARLYSIAVDRRARGQGLGAALLAACERKARAAGARRMCLEVRQDNRPAIALYEQRGYLRQRAIPNFYEDGADAWRYCRPLAA